MSSVVIAGNTSGSVTLAAPDVAGTTTLTLPATSGTVMVNGPAFSAYSSTNQTITSGVATKVTLNTKTFDTNTNFDAITNYRFTPTVAGYYQLNAGLQGQGTSLGAIAIYIYKNGSVYKSQISAIGGTVSFVSMSISDLIYMNGTTDYIELYGQVNATSPFLSGGINNTYISGSLVRSA